MVRMAFEDANLSDIVATGSTFTSQKSPFLNAAILHPFLARFPCPPMLFSL